MNTPILTIQSRISTLYLQPLSYTKRPSFQSQYHQTFTRPSPIIILDKHNQLQGPIRSKYRALSTTPQEGEIRRGDL